MTLTEKIVRLCLSVAVLASAGMAHADAPITDEKLALARQQIRCGKTAMMLAQVRTGPGATEYYSGVALVLGGRALKAGATQEMAQGWSQELLDQIKDMDETARKTFWAEERAICKKYGVPDTLDAVR